MIVRPVEEIGYAIVLACYAEESAHDAILLFGPALFRRESPYRLLFEELRDR
jgi:hypothetical protein